MNCDGDVAWIRNDGFDREVFLYERSSDNKIQLSHNSFGVWTPKLNRKGNIVWAGYDGYAYGIFLHNRTRETTIRLTENDQSVRVPQINDTGDVIWQGYDGHDWEIFLTQNYKVEVEIDIKPGSSTNSINLKSRGVVPVAILTTDNFDARNVRWSSVSFAGASPVKWSLKNVGGDEELDMLLHFRTQELVELNENSTEAKLSGETLDETAFEDTDTVNIIPKKRYRK